MHSLSGIGLPRVGGIKNLSEQQQDEVTTQDDRKPWKPKPLTEDQRDLSQRVARIIRFRPAEFAEAGQWLDAGAELPSQAEELKHVRAGFKRRARARRKMKNRGYLIHDDGEPLHVRRTIEARRIRTELGEATSPLPPYGLIQHVASRFLAEPPVFDVMKPDAKARVARRWLLVVWILSDTCEDSGLPIPRLYARINILERNLPSWEKLTREAIHALEQVDPSIQVIADGNFSANGKPAQTVSVNEPARALSKEARALAALTDHPNWTDEQIAEAAGCNRKSLYRMRKFVDAKRLLKSTRDSIPTGTKDRETGAVEAWDDPSDDE